MSFGGFTIDAIRANQEEFGKLKGFTQIDIKALNTYNQLLTQQGMDGAKALEILETKYGNLSKATKTYITNAKGSQVQTDKLSKSFSVLGLKGFAAQAGMMALNAALNVGISLAVSAAITWIYNLITAQDRAIEKASELQAGWESSAQSLAETKSTVSEISGEYETLAQGVDSLGNNISLTTDEYARYNQIANQIASMFPEMVQGYTAEGNAIIKNAGNVKELTAAYERLAEAQRSTVISEANDVIKGIRAQTVDDTGLFGQVASKARQYEALQKYFGYLDEGNKQYADWVADPFLSMAKDIFGVEDSAEAIDEALYAIGKGSAFKDLSKNAYENKTQLRAYMRSLASQINAAAAGYYPIIEAILGGEEGYKQLTDETQALISSVVHNLDPKKFLAFEDYDSLGTYLVSSIVTPFEGAEGEKITSTISDALNVADLVSSSKTSFKYLVSAYNQVEDSIKDMAPEVQESILSMFDVDLERGNALVGKLKDYVKDPETLFGFTLDELEIAATLKLDPEVDIDAAELKAQIRNVQAKVAESAAEIKASYSVTNTAQSALNDALAETEAVGAISAETYEKLISANKNFAYALDNSNGYLNINYEEAQKVIDAEYEMQKAQVAQAKAQNKLNYAENAKRLEEIAYQLNNTNPKEEERNRLLAEQARIQADQSGILSEIKNLDILASSLAYATGAYKKWLDAQSAPEDSDIFDSLSGAVDQITSGLESGKIGTRKYASAAELIFGPNWEKMTEAEIQAGLKNVESYFTESSEGMKIGVDKLVGAGLMIEQNGKYFSIAGRDIEDYAAALGLGEEATQYFLAALNDYGWDIDIPGIGETTEQILAYEKAMDEVAKKEAELSALLSEFDISIATKEQLEEIEAAQKALEDAKAAAEDLSIAPEVEVPKTELETLQENLDNIKAAYAELEDVALTGIVSPDVVDAFTAIQGGVAALGEIPEDGYSLNIQTEEDVAAVEEAIASLQEFISKIEEAEAAGRISHDIAANLTGNATEQLEFLQTELAKYQGTSGVPDATITIDADTKGAKRAVDELRSSVSKPITIPVVVSTPSTISAPKVNGIGGGSGTGGGLFNKIFGYSKGTSNAPDGVALVGEGVKNGKYQPEIVVKSKTGEYFVTDRPQLIDLERGDQVINGEQTKKILGNKQPKGGKAYAGGFMDAIRAGISATTSTLSTAKKKKEEEELLKAITNVASSAISTSVKTGAAVATSGGVKASGSFNGDTSNKNNSGGGSGGSSNKAPSSSSSGASTASKGNNFVDWIQRLLDRLKKYTDKLVRQAEKAIGYTAKNAHLDKAIANIEIELDKNQAAYERYLKQAESVGLSEELKKKVREGEIDIASYDDNTRELITNYQKWYDLANDCLDTVEELKDQQIELSHQKLDNINAYYEDRIDRLEAQATKGQSTIDLKAATGKEIFGGDYKTIIKATEREIEELTEQRSVLNDEFTKMVASGIIEKDSEAWHEYVGQLESLDSEIIQTQIDLSGFKDALANVPLTNLQYAMNALQETQKVMENMLSLHEAQNADNEAGDYEKLIRNSIEQISNLEKQNILLREQLLGLDVLSEKYQEIQSQIADNEDEILNAKIAQEEWNDAILDLKISKLEQEREELEKTNDAYQRQKELQEALDDLEKAKRQKTVRIYKEGKQPMPLYMVTCNETGEYIG